MSTVGKLGEVGLIRALREVFDRPLPHLVVPNGDDAAVLRCEGHIVATVDAIVEGVDWLSALTPAVAIGHRAAAVNLSDLAAMGARPTGLLLAVELPPSAKVSQVLESARGLAELADRFGTAVVGGDFGLASGPQRWCVTALGEVTGQPLRRDAARPGDIVWLVGQVGHAGLGLELLRRQGAGFGEQPWVQACVRAHLYPQPLVSEGLLLQALGEDLAAIDLSDGLGLDAARLASASGLCLELDLPAPHWLTPEVENGLELQGLDWRVACASGGDDYALLVSAPPGVDLSLLFSAAGHALASVRPIGRSVAGEPGGVRLWVGGREVPGGGWLHGRGRVSRLR
ncbi:MAG: thiamine-phosphate kinase [Myxococcota bacterium]